MDSCTKHKVNYYIAINVWTYLDRSPTRPKSHKPPLVSCLFVVAHYTSKRTLEEICNTALLEIIHSLNNKYLKIIVSYNLILNLICKQYVQSNKNQFFSEKNLL